MGPKGYELVTDALGSLKDGPFEVLPDKPPQEGEKVLSINIFAAPHELNLIISAFTQAGISAYLDGQPSAKQLEDGLPALDINWGTRPGVFNFKDLNPDSL